MNVELKINALAQLISQHGETRVLDLINKGLKYERSRAKQCESAKDRRIIMKAAMKVALANGFNPEDLEAGEEV